MGVGGVRHGAHHARAAGELGAKAKFDELGKKGGAEDKAKFIAGQLNLSADDKTAVQTAFASSGGLYSLENGKIGFHFEGSDQNPSINPEVARGLSLIHQFFTGKPLDETQLVGKENVVIPLDSEAKVVTQKSRRSKKAKRSEGHDAHAQVSKQYQKFKSAGPKGAADSLASLHPDNFRSRKS